MYRMYKISKFNDICKNKSGIIGLLGIK